MQYSQTQPLATITTLVGQGWNTTNVCASMSSVVILMLALSDALSCTSISRISIVLFGRDWHQVGLHTDFLCELRADAFDIFKL